jgi:Fe2+ or Zn2+ uptake regulation protein
MKTRGAQAGMQPMPGPERQRFEWAMTLLRKAKVRLTRPRRRILQALVNRPLPVSLDVLGEELGSECDLATIYRTMRRFHGLGIVRQMHLDPERACYFLGAPGECAGYLICRKCGGVKSLPEAEAMMALGRKVAVAAGFKIWQQEVEFYGVCAACQRREG